MKIQVSQKKEVYERVEDGLLQKLFFETEMVEWLLDKRTKIKAAREIVEEAYQAVKPGDKTTQEYK